MSSSLDRAVEEAHAALVDRFVPTGSLLSVEWSGGLTKAVAVGEGPPVLCLHGGLGNAWEWFPIMSAIAETRQVFALHRPGHGLADPFDYRGVGFREHAVTFLCEAADALGLDRVDVIGNSVGGMWAVMLGLDEPDRVGRLVLAGMPMGVKRSGPFEIHLLGAPVIGRQIGKFTMRNSTVEANRKFWGKVLVANPQAVDDLMLVADAASQRRNVDSMLSLVSNIGRVGGMRADLMFGDEWNALQVPTLMIVGDRDKFGSPDDAETATKSNESIEITTVPNAGHLPWIDRPEPVTERIRHFLNT